MEGETGSTDRVRVIGALTGPPLELLLEMVGCAEVMLDLSEVHEVDSDAVRLLAQLAADQYKLLACPKWLPPEGSGGPSRALRLSGAPERSSTSRVPWSHGDLPRTRAVRWPEPALWCGCDLARATTAIVLAPERARGSASPRRTGTSQSR
jgi:hypothetical protein